MAVAPKAIRGEPLPMTSEAKRHDTWWVEPLIVVVVLGSFSIYATWAAFQNANYYAAPYLSPFYSPCLATSCAHVTIPLVGSWWSLLASPPDPLDSAWLQSDLLLLPKGVLPVVLLVAARLRRP